MQKDDFVKTNKNGVLNVGKVQSVSEYSIYVWSATTGQNDVFSPSQTEPATREEYDAQTELRMKPQPKKTAPAPTQPKTVPTQTQTYRWLCLECGNKYNGRECPSCGGEDRILNSGKDGDNAILGGFSRAEAMFPED